MSNTHTHSPSIQSGPPPGQGAPGAQRPRETGPSEPILQAVREAKATLQPAKVGFGTGNS